MYVLVIKQPFKVRYTERINFKTLFFMLCHANSYEGLPTGQLDLIHTYSNLMMRLVSFLLYWMTIVTNLRINSYKYSRFVQFLRIIKQYVTVDMNLRCIKRVL